MNWQQESPALLLDLLCALHRDEVLSEQQCAKRLGVDLLEWRRLRDVADETAREFGIPVRDDFDPKAWAEHAAARLVADCKEAGLVLTIEQVNLQPPAMGNFATTVAVRPARGNY